MKQYTIRGIPDYIDRIAREQTRKLHKSLNSVLLDALQKGLDTEQSISYNDMDDLIGSWAADPGTDEALESFSKIDEDLWK